MFRKKQGGCRSELAMDGARTGNVSHTNAPNVSRSVTEAQNDRGAPTCPGLLRTNLFRLHSSSASLCMVSQTKFVYGHTPHT